MSSNAYKDFPALNSVWRERDNRFVRHVKIVGYDTTSGQPPRVMIETVDANDGRTVGARVTKAALTAFGRRYLPVAS